MSISQAYWHRKEAPLVGDNFIGWATWHNKLDSLWEQEQIITIYIFVLSSVFYQSLQHVSSIDTNLERYGDWGAAPTLYCTGVEWESDSWRQRKESTNIYTV